MKNALKTIIALSLATVVAFSLAACKNDMEQPVITTPEDVSNIEDEIKITVPLISIDEEYRDDMDALCKAYGYTSAKLNKRKETVTITTNAFRHKLAMTRIGMRVIKAIYDLEESKDYPYLVSIDDVNKDDFSSATITVKADKFQDLLPYVIGQDLMIYKFYEGKNDFHVSVTVKDEKGNLIDTFDYSDKDE